MWARYDNNDFFDDENFSEDEFTDSCGSDDSDASGKRDPALSRKRQIADVMTPPGGRPKLKRVMSNSEKGMCYLADWHVNDKKLTSVNMATPDVPDHTYSAVGFNIHGQPTGHVIRINGFSIGGQLNRIRIYMCKNKICHLIREDKSQWTKVYDKRHKEAWANNVDVMFEEPICIPPCQNVAFYIHSDRQDDLGLKYRSCAGRKAIIHKDSHILITRGFAHTSPVPFNLRDGWFRENRVLSGNVYYDALPIRWTNFSHDHFPADFQHAVFNLRQILVEEQDWHEHIVDNIIEFFSWDHFGEEITITQQKFIGEVEDSMKGIGRSPYSDFW